MMENLLNRVLCFDGFLSVSERTSLQASLADLCRRTPLVYQWMPLPRTNDGAMPLQRLAEKVREHVPRSDRVVGIEYWSVVLSAGEGIDWHLDKDEYRFWTQSGELSQPEVSAVVYVHDLPVRGGALEIEGHGSIEPDPGRLVLVPGSLLHRVHTVLEGHRSSVVMNFWSTVPMAYREDRGNGVVG